MSRKLTTAQAQKIARMIQEVIFGDETNSALTQDLKKLLIKRDQHKSSGEEVPEALQDQIWSLIRLIVTEKSNSLAQKEKESE